MGSEFQATVKDHQKQSVTLQCDKSISCTISVVRNDTFRILFLKDGVMRMPKTWSVLQSGEIDVPWEGNHRMTLLEKLPDIATDISFGENRVYIKSSSLFLEVQLSPLQLVWKLPDGTQIARDRASKPYFFFKKRNEIRHYMQRNSGDRFYGLGDKTGPLDLHGRRLRTAMSDALGYDPLSGDPMYKHWPFLITVDSLSNTAYGLLYDNMCDASFDLGCEHSNYYGRYRSYEVTDGDLDYYFVVGPTVADVVRANARLTGTQAMVPRWALGYHCTAMPLADAIDAQDRIESFIDDCERFEIPCSAFHFGSGYTSIGPKRYVFHWNTEKFPEPRRLIGRFREAGMRVVANLKPCLLSDHPKYSEVAGLGAFVSCGEGSEPSVSQFWDGHGAHLDFTNEAAVSWWQENLQSEILDLGISSSWNDNNEYEVWDEDASCRFFTGSSPVPLSLCRPLHSLLMTRASLVQQLRHAPKERPYVVTRGGMPGVQRYAQTWSGDNTTSWASLRYNLRTGLQMGLSGMASVGHDVGGFAGPAPGPELLLRWFQACLLCPRLITNSWKSDGRVTTPWMHPTVLPEIRWALRLRYRLLPYLYSLCRSAAETGSPVIRPTFYDQPGDATCHREDPDDFMAGPALLVAPVVVPGARSRQVYLPQGPPGGWFDFITEEWYPPGEVVTVAAGLGTLPLFVPAGAVVPVTDEAKDFGKLHDEASRNLRVFPIPAKRKEKLGLLDSGFVGEDGVEPFVLWEDDGITKDGSFRALRFSVRATEEEVFVKVWSEKGGFELPYETMKVSLPVADLRKLRLEVVGDEGLKLKLEEGKFLMHER